MEIGEIIKVQPGTELNRGYHEDSDFVEVLEPIEVVVNGEHRNGALPVQIIDGRSGQIFPDQFYYHLPVDRTPNREF